jgi:hypothetical protein
MGLLAFLRTRRRPVLTALLLATPLVAGAVALQRFAAPCDVGTRAAQTPDATRTPRTPGPSPLVEPRAVLGRYWFDRLPENERDSVSTYVFLAGGLAVREDGSFWRSTTEYFDLERRGNALSLASLHDGKKAELTFSIERCDDKPPFDLCLTLEGGGEAQRKLYGFTYGEDLSRALPRGGTGSARFARARGE